MVTARRSSGPWLLDSALPGLAKQTLEGNVFNVVVPGSEYTVETLDQGSPLPRTRISPPNPERIVDFRFDSNDIFPALVSIKGIEQEAALSFYRVYRSDRRMEDAYRRFKFITTEWTLISCPDTPVADQTTPTVHSYIFRATKWVKSLSDTETDNVYEEVDVDNQIHKSWPLIVSGGLITGRGEEVNLFNPDQYPAAFTTAGAA